MAVQPWSEANVRMVLPANDTSTSRNEEVAFLYTAMRDSANAMKDEERFWSSCRPLDYARAMNFADRVGTRVGSVFESILGKRADLATAVVLSRFWRWATDSRNPSASPSIGLEDEAMSPPDILGTLMGSYDDDDNRVIRECFGVFKGEGDIASIDVAPLLAAVSTCKQTAFDQLVECAPPKGGGSDCPISAIHKRACEAIAAGPSALSDRLESLEQWRETVQALLGDLSRSETIDELLSAVDATIDVVSSTVGLTVDQNTSIRKVVKQLKHCKPAPVLRDIDTRLGEGEWTVRMAQLPRLERAQARITIDSFIEAVQDFLDAAAVAVGRRASSVKTSAEVERKEKELELHLKSLEQLFSTIQGGE